MNLRFQILSALDGRLCVSNPGLWCQFFFGESALRNRGGIESADVATFYLSVSGHNLSLYISQLALQCISILQNVSIVFAFWWKFGCLEWIWFSYSMQILSANSNNLLYLPIVIIYDYDNVELCISLSNSSASIFWNKHI